MVLETKRLILRPWQESDAQSLYEFASSPDVGPIAGWQVHTSVENSREIIRTVFSKPETYAVIDKNTAAAIGSIGLMIGDESHLGLPDTECELGFWIGVPYWGQGLIPEATEEILRHAFEELNMEKVWCGYYEGNFKSRRVQEKCGFRYQFTRKNVPCVLMNDVRTEYFTSQTKEDWQCRTGRHAD